MFGDEKEKNLIQLMVFDNSSGTTRPVTELASIPYWPQASYRNHSEVSAIRQISVHRQ